MTARILQYPVGLDGVVTRVLECGMGDDILVCLHGAGSRADRWRPALPLLAEAGFHVYAMDFPGHGLAAKPSGYPYGTPAFALAVTEFLDSLERATVSILGTSIGGHVAATVACADPIRVRSTVLIGAVGLTVDARSDEPVASPIVDGSPNGIRKKLEFLVEDQSLVTDEWVQEEARVNSSPGAANALAALGRYSAESLDGDVVGKAYAELGVPTLLCWGAQDRWIPPRVGYQAAMLLPTSPLCLVERAGHAPYFERPEAFCDMVVPFLRDAGAYPPGTFSV